MKNIWVSHRSEIIFLGINTVWETFICAYDWSTINLIGWLLKYIWDTLIYISVNRFYNPLLFINLCLRVSRSKKTCTRSHRGTGVNAFRSPVMCSIQFISRISSSFCGHIVSKIFSFLGGNVFRSLIKINNIKLNAFKMNEKGSMKTVERTFSFTPVPIRSTCFRSLHWTNFAFNIVHV